jgi:hypothetical protein
MARTTGEMMLERPPDQPSVEEGMQSGIAAVRSGDRAAAYDIFQRTTAAHPESAELWVWLAGTTPSLDEAENAFRQAQLLDPGNEEAALGLRWVAIRRQFVSQAVLTAPPPFMEERFAPAPVGDAPPAEAGQGAPKTPGRYTRVLFGHEVSTTLILGVLVGVIIVLAIIVWILTRGGAGG